jgi:hypothetical protein
MMHFVWKGRPLLMIPGLAYAVTRRGTGWVRVNVQTAAREAEPLHENEFWAEFSGWDLPPFPVAFGLLDTRRSKARA